MVRWQRSRLDELTPRELYAVLRLRSEVFVVEQACAFLDADGLDLDAWHLLGWDGPALVAVARLLPADGVGGEVAIGRVATAPSHRGRGLGRALMECALAEVEALWGRVPVVVGAQAHLARFYGSLGFEVCGEPYDEDGIPHVPMRRAS